MGYCQRCQPARSTSGIDGRLDGQAFAVITSPLLLDQEENKFMGRKLSSNFTHFDHDFPIGSYDTSMVLFPGVGICIYAYGPRRI
ncbi:hypothetical protein F5146DRAFT_1138856 [Armillaria mellea]|nr:hypothetical protein F5146DRAFT_1138856 [Armillaria mellea]